MASTVNEEHMQEQDGERGHGMFADLEVIQHDRSIRYEVRKQGTLRLQRERNSNKKLY